ncbi:multicopper oxidase domain-containing protein [Glaciimonas sp. GG7]
MPIKGDVISDLQTTLIAAAKANYPLAVRNKVVKELKDGLKLSSFVPHRTIDASEVTGKQTLTFNIDTTKEPLVYEVNGQPYDPSRIDRVLKLGGVDEWNLSSEFADHPFHIHVNPFQIVKILTPEGVDISGDDGVDPDKGDSQYVGMKGVWKDTLYVKNTTDPNDPTNPKKGGKYTIIVRTRYERYIGDIVLHCHILDHEDQGMMQNNRIALPDGQGGVASLHSGHH